MEQSPLKIRSATLDDLEAIIALTRAYRQRLAEWAPIYFNPRQGADENHANFLRFIVGSDEHQTLVLTQNEDPVGFFTEIPQEQHLWIDDLCISTETLWPLAVLAIAGRIKQNWVTCVSVADTGRLDALAAAGLSELSGYYALPMVPTGSVEQEQEFEAAPVSIPDHQPVAAAHTFGGQAFSPQLPGALVIANDIGFVIGSPSAEPPIYDPGGPTCVIDQIHGDDRNLLLEGAVGLSADRGDAQVIVVCDTADDELADTLLNMGFTKVVSLQGTPVVANVAG